MGGRGASSGVSTLSKDEKRGGKSYGSQYHTVHQVDNIKFVTALHHRDEQEPLWETMTKGRIYVRVAGDELKSINYYDDEGKKYKQIDLDHYHNKMKPHTHHGYKHAEYDGPEGGTDLTLEERAMVDRVTRAWEDYKRRG